MMRDLLLQSNADRLALNRILQIMRIDIADESYPLEPIFCRGLHM